MGGKNLSISKFRLKGLRLDEICVFVGEYESSVSRSSQREIIEIMYFNYSKAMAQRGNHNLLLKSLHKLIVQQLSKAQKYFD
jgi:hypothetical protein